MATLSSLNQNAILWHPFTQASKGRQPISIIRGEGSCLFADDGRIFLDAISSWWVNLHGHRHPYIVKKINEQLEKLEHVIFADFTHPAADELAKKLCAILPEGLSHVFYSDNGSTAVEVALKIALQFWYNQEAYTKKTKVISFKKGYHGDTFGAMSAAGKNELNRPFWSHMFESIAIDLPLKGTEERSVAQLKALLSKNDVACFIFEPLLLGVGGMQIYPAAGLDLLLEICREHGVLTIADEVMTGFGRTGPDFACNALKEKPDMICLAKGITGGFLPLGATICKSFIYDAFFSSDTRKAFLHGHSYAGNPLACSAALASIDLLKGEQCQTQRREIAKSHRQFCEKWQQHPKLKRCESFGTILVLEYATKEEDSYFNSIRDRLYEFFLGQEILLRPFGNVLHVMPPYCITQEELHRIYQQIVYTLENKL